MFRYAEIVCGRNCLRRKLFVAEIDRGGNCLRRKLFATEPVCGGNCLWRKLFAAELVCGGNCLWRKCLWWKVFAAGSVAAEGVAAGSVLYKLCWMVEVGQLSFISQTNNWFVNTKLVEKQPFSSWSVCPTAQCIPVFDPCLQNLSAPVGKWFGCGFIFLLCPFAILCVGLQTEAWMSVLRWRKQMLN